MWAGVGDPAPARIGLHGPQPLLRLWSLPLGSADWLPPARLSEREAVRISSQVAPFWVRQSSPVTAIAQERSLNGKQPLPGFH